MADDLLALADLLVINDMSVADLEISDILDDAAILRAMYSDVASNGTVHKYNKETGAPVVGFRSPNAGRELDSSADTQVSIDLKILDASFLVDLALANAYQRGGPQALVAREARRHLRAALFAAEKQLVNGTGNDAGGFTGLINAATINGLTDEMVVDADGDTALTSVYLLRSTPDGNNVAVIVGQDGEISIGDTVTQMATDADDKKYPALWTPVQGWMGLQVGGARSIGRICNIGTDTGKGLTDDLIYAAFAKFPAGAMPTHIAMNRRSREQLRKSRTATNATGTPAPIPTEVDGVPIVCTDAILNSETAVA